MQSQLEVERNRVLDALSEAFSHDRLGMDDYERMVTEASAAKNLMELESVASKTGTSLRRNQQQDASSSSSENSVHASGRNVSSASVAIFSGSELKGKFRAGRTHKAMAIFGGVEIDLREAEFSREGMVIDCVAAFGGVEISVPDDVNVVTHGFGLMGGFSSTHNNVEISGAPTVHIRGIAVFGGVEVKVRPRKPIQGY